MMDGSSHPENDVQAAARRYLARGWMPMPVVARGKRPSVGENWQDFVATDATPFPGNVGVKLGAPSNGLIDVDLDCTEAVTLAPHFLPPTGAVFGRRSKRRSHYLYRCEPPPERTEQFKAPVGMLVEIRSTGGQTVFPPSIHESGEPIEWDGDGEPALVAINELVRRVGDLAGMSLLARHWPDKSNRYNAEGALCGALLRAGRSPEEVERLLEIMQEVKGAARDHPPKRTVKRFVDKLANNERVPGLPKLRECVGKEVADVVAEWMRLKPTRQSALERLMQSEGLNEEAIAALERKQQKHKLSKADKEEIAKAIGRDADEVADLLKRYKAARRIAEAIAEGDNILDPTAPLDIARVFVEERDRPMRNHAADFYEWTGTYYLKQDDRDVNAMLYRFLDAAKDSNGDPFKPDDRAVKKVSHALGAEVHVSSQVKPPAWLAGDAPEGPLLACRNGIVSLEDGKLFPHTPDFFNMSSVDFDYDPNAAEPAEFNKFLKSIFGDDRESVEALQEICGYAVSGAQAFQKMFMLVGPPRCGKGTIGRLLGKLLGTTAVVGPTLASLTETFGLEQLINKSLAVIPDARLRGKSHEIVERLLAISGGDSLSIGRKYKGAWNGFLPTRIVILTNEVPAFSDKSGAIASRFIILEFRNSFLGKEDLALGDKLDCEMPAILNWAIAGWKRLKQRGNFIQPKAAERAVRTLGNLASGTKQFVEECCERGLTYSETKDRVFGAWIAWCEAMNIEHPGTLATFSRDLYAAAPGIDESRTRIGGGARETMFVGIRLREGVPVRRPDDFASKSAATRPPATEVGRVSQDDMERDFRASMEGSYRQREPGDEDIPY